MLFSRSVVSNSATPWTAARLVSLYFTISQSLLKFMSIESVMPSNHLILCHHLLIQPSIIPSIRVFSNELALRNRWPKYWTISISPSKEYLGLAAILQCSAFFMVQLSHTHMTIGKEYLTLWIIVGKVISLLFIMLSRFVITFLPRSKCL